MNTNYFEIERERETPNIFLKLGDGGMAVADKKLVTNGKISGTLIKKPTIRKA